jgi:hypothetical protein
MASKLGVELDAIEAARKSVIELTLAHQTTARVARKQAVKDLFGTLMASWEAGVPFDKMADALNKSGIDITTETLRSYFFELKTDAQLRGENAEHERAMSKMRKETEAKQRAIDLQHARAITQVGTELATSTRAASVEAAHLAASEVVQSARRRSSSMRPAAPAEAPPAEAPPAEAPPAGREPSRQPSRQPAENKAQAARTERGTASVPNVGSMTVEPAVVVEAATSAREPVQQGTGATEERRPADAPADAPTGTARTLDEIAKASQGQQETSFTENLVVKEGGTVWCESGSPFEGYLSPRTLHTLRNVGKVIAPTVGRTAKDFVPMSHEL